MEPSALKDYLETLLVERNDRVLGGILKNPDATGLCYKEIIPINQQTDSCTEQLSTANKKTAQCQTTPEKTTTQFDACAANELYQNYALNALKNLANMINTTPVEKTASCQNGSSMKSPVDCKMSEDKVASCNTPAIVNTAPVNACTAVMQLPEEVMQINLLISQQLERIEHMIREMYITNQELFKSIITYCRTYTENQ